MNDFFQDGEPAKTPTVETPAIDKKKADGYVNQTVLGSITDQKFDFETEKNKVIDNLKAIKAGGVQEFTFEKKWKEIGDCSDLFVSFAGEAKGKIWSPTDLNNETLTIEEINKLEPYVKVVANDYDEKLWTTLRIYCSTAEFEQAPGRFYKFFVMNGDKVLGVMSVASDVISISDRDTFLGWTKDDKLTNKMLKHSAIGTTIVPTQPFGCNFLGGKFVASMVVSSVVRNEWEHPTIPAESIPCKLVGMTTTSLYGRPSMYDSLKWWKCVGGSKGKIPIKMDEQFYEIWHSYVRQHDPNYLKQMTQKEGVSGPVTGAKMRVLSMIFKAIGVKQSDFNHGYERGVYYSCFYENTKEFLQRKIQEKDLKLKPLFQGDVQAIVDWWKPKAIERYKKLKLENKLDGEKLFYLPMANMTYQEAKAKYFRAVGR